MEADELAHMLSAHGIHLTASDKEQVGRSLLCTCSAVARYSLPAAQLVSSMGNEMGQIDCLALCDVLQQTRDRFSL